MAGIFQYDAGLARAIGAYRADHAGRAVRRLLRRRVPQHHLPRRAGRGPAGAGRLPGLRAGRPPHPGAEPGGHLRAAIAFDTSYAHGNSNWAFTQYDNALLAVIAINQHAFNAAITAGQHGVQGWTGLIPAAAVMVILALLVVGVLPRLAEYRE